MTAKDLILGHFYNLGEFDGKTPINGGTYRFRQDNDMVSHFFENDIEMENIVELTDEEKKAFLRRRSDFEISKGKFVERWGAE